MNEKIDSNFKKVALFIESSTSWGRQMIFGIHQVALRHSWSIYLEARGAEQNIAIPSNWCGDGIIARVSTKKMAEELLALKLPVVNVSGIEIPGVDFPRVSVDLESSASLVADYFLSRGYQNFAYCGLKDNPYADRQCQKFCDDVAKKGYLCAVHKTESLRGLEPTWMKNAPQFCDWLTQLPKPVAILTWTPNGAREIVQICMEQQISIPDEVAVLSGSDDDLFCALSIVPISAIKNPSEGIGRMAAQMLYDVMNENPLPINSKQLAPDAIITRHSTDTLAITDKKMVKALTYIRVNFRYPIQVEDIAKASGTARRALERKFTALLNRSPGDELRIQRLNHAKKLLAETDMLISEVSEQSGFMSAQYMAYVFKSECNMTALQYRKKNYRVN